MVRWRHPPAYLPGRWGWFARGLKLIGDDMGRVDGVIRGEGLVIRLGGDHANLGREFPTSRVDCDLDSRIGFPVDGTGRELGLRGSG
jgi:hypothetical protein